MTPVVSPPDRVSARDERLAAIVSKSFWLHKARDYANAEHAARRAIMLAPSSAAAREARGLALIHLKRFTEAETELRRAIALQPPAPRARSFLATLLRETGRLDQAEREFRALLEPAPALASDMPVGDLAYRFGHLLLSQGRLLEGWRYYEGRRADEEAGAFPRWTGEDISGKSVLVWPEQGFGDQVMFARYMPLLAARGASVTVVSSPPLRALLSTVAGAREVTAGEPIENARFDYWVPIGSIPLLLQAGDVPAFAPYLQPDAARVSEWQRRLPKKRPLVGLCWKGRAEHVNDAERSLQFEQLRPLWDSGATFVSLQKGRDESMQMLSEQPILQLGAEIEDFADVAAIVAQVDVVVTIDTALANIAGALGRPGFVLLPAFQCDWRWTLAGERTPWYPTLRLFRQGSDYRWAPPVATAASELQKLFPRGG